MTPIDHLTRAYFRSIGAQSRWVPSSLGEQHSLEVAGGGTLGTLILLHGLSARGTHFALMVRRLRPHFGRIVIPDILGHGLSPGLDRPIRGPEMQQTVDEVLDALVPEPATIYGNSLGGYGAIRFAGSRPERVRALIINSPAGAAIAGMSMQQYMDRFRLSSREEAAAFAEQYFGGQVRLRRLVARGVMKQLSNPTVQGFIDQLCEDDLHTPEHLARLSMPTLLLWGRRDGIMLPEQLDFYRQHLPEHARLEEPEAYGHAPYIEHASDLAGRLVAFVRAAQPAPVGGG
ncbi:MAG: pimeloyl-ACP methyl ester carboxylesterase [Myxococcota bacterium]|jgi:pimeloyl-ACP methyl ester carboxylesterase